MPLRARSNVLTIAALAALWLAPGAGAQVFSVENPVFVNDSPRATEAFLSIQENLARGNVEQSLRLLQKLLEDEPHALVPQTDDPTSYRSVRSAVHAMLLGDPDLLARYRRAHSTVADTLLNEGRAALVERSWFLTPAGVRAAAIVATGHMEAARFDAALLALAQLETHPDRTSDAARAEAGASLARLARYHPAGAAMLARWRAEGAAPPGPEPETIAPPPAPAITSPLMPQANDLTALGTLVAQPLSSTQYTPPDTDAARPATGDPDQLPPLGRELRCMPALMGDTVYIASAAAVSAFDRFTLMPRWGFNLADLPEVVDPPRAPEERPFFRGRMPINPLDDVRSLAVRPSILLVAAAAEPQGGEAREALVALDPRTGRQRWATSMSRLSEDLDRAHIRGPVVVDPSGTMGYLAARKDLRERRLRALYLAGVDCTDGSPAWSALVGSVGSLPYVINSTLGEGAILHEGILYTADRIGLLCAYEAATGRPVWVRRLPGEPLDSPFRSSPWQISMPIVHGDRLIVLSPDRKSILSVARSTGRTLESTTADRAAQTPAYLLKVGTWVAALADATITFFPIENLSGIALREDFKPPGIRGRAVAGGDRLLVPLERGVAELIAGEAIERREQPLDDAGNMIFVDEQLLVADDARLHSYLSWTSADRVLSARIASQPGDPSAGIALAELAYRSSHDHRILVGVDAASAALAAGGDPAGDHAARLLASLRAMIDAAQGGPPPVGRAPVPAALGAQLVERFGRVARGPTDRAAYHLMLGRSLDDAARHTDAAAAYQTILDDPSLGEVMWQGPRLGVRAETEATRRLEQLVAQHGRAVYARFEVAAERALAALPPDPAIDAMERLARRYPVSLTCPRLWDRIAALHETNKRSRAAARALEIGLQAAERIPDVPPAVIAELAGRLVTGLLDRGLAYAAEETLRRVKRAWGELPLTSGGLPVDAATAVARIAEERALHQRWPVTGLPLATDIQVLAGWTLMDPLVREVAPSAPERLAMRHIDGRIALFAPTPGAPGPAALAPIWTLQSERHQAELLRLDHQAAIFYAAGADGGSLVKVESRSGHRLWTTEPFTSAFPAESRLSPNPLRGPMGGRGAGERLETPLDGVRPMNEVVFNSDERTLTVVERTGRAVAYDADSGQRLWAVTLPLSGVFDCALFRNLLAVAGQTERQAGPAGGRIRQSQLVLLDARTGELLHAIDQAQDALRWVRFTDRGDLLAGLAGAVAAFDTETGAVAWTNTQPPCAATLAAWVLGERALIQAENRQAWLLSTTTGLLRNAPVDTRDRLDSGATPRAALTEPGALLLATPQGLALVAPDGTLLGTDALAGGATLLPPALTRTGVLLMEAEPSSRDRAAPAAYNLHVLDARSAALQRTVPLALTDPPARIAALDGRLAITAGPATYVLSAPADAR